MKTLKIIRPSLAFALSWATTAVASSSNMATGPTSVMALIRTFLKSSSNSV